MQRRYTGARWLALGLIFASPFLPLLWFQGDCATEDWTQVQEDSQGSVAGIHQHHRHAQEGTTLAELIDSALKITYDERTLTLLT
jgi:hypothetical protein